MQTDWLARQTRLIGEQATRRLTQARVAVIGLGGVGGAACEALCRAGIGALLLADCDVFDLTNLNRQILSTREKIGRPKVEVARERVLAISPECAVSVWGERLGADNLEAIFAFSPDFVLDAVDCVTAKLALIEGCKRRGIGVVSCMGTGNRLDASGFTIGDIEATVGCGCGLARVMRRELRRRGIRDVPVLYSTEPPSLPGDGQRTPASVSFVPPVAGYLLAGYVVRALLAAPQSPAVGREGSR